MTTILVDCCDVRVLIPDAKGTEQEYVASFPPCEDEFAVVLDRQDTGARHAVVKLGPASWRCSCGDSTYRHGRGRRSDCKHLVAARDLFQLFRAMSEQRKREV
jgi:hypothetical protein